MERYRSCSFRFELAMYRISIQGTLGKNWSDYYGGMTIEHGSDPQRKAMTILTGILVDQSALMGVLNSLHDTGYPILAVECIDASPMRISRDELSDDVEH